MSSYSRWSFSMFNNVISTMLFQTFFSILFFHLFIRIVRIQQIIIHSHIFGISPYIVPDYFHFRPPAIEKFLFGFRRFSRLVCPHVRMHVCVFKRVCLCMRKYLRIFIGYRQSVFRFRTPANPSDICLNQEQSCKLLVFITRFNTIWL